MFPVISSSVPFLCTLLFSKGLQESSKEGRERETAREKKKKKKKKGSARGGLFEN